MAAAPPQIPPPPPAAAGPALWHEPAPRHFDAAVPCWLKALIIALCTILAMIFLDQRVALWARAHPIPDLAGRPLVQDPTSTKYRGGDIGRELMFLEQWGQFTCSVVVIAAVGLIDPKGRRRALAIAIGCLATLALTHLLKDLCGRSRPFIPGSNENDGSWIFGGPHMGFTGGAKWGSFPSAHTTAAFALAAGLAWFYPRGRALFVGLSLITATLRVLHTAHFLSDVIAGMGLGIFVARWTLSAKLAGRLIALAPANLRTWWQQNP